MNSFDIIAVYGNKVECSFYKVERCFDVVAGVDGALEFTSHSTQNRSFKRRDSQPVFWLGTEETKLPKTT